MFPASVGAAKRVWRRYNGPLLGASPLRSLFILQRSPGIALKECELRPVRIERELSVIVVERWRSEK